MDTKISYCMSGPSVSHWKKKNKLRSFSVIQFFSRLQLNYYRENKNIQIGMIWNIYMYICTHIINFANYWLMNNVKVLVTQLCPTLCDPMDCSPPGSSVHGILHARTLEWVSISISGGIQNQQEQTNHYSCFQQFKIRQE